MLTTIKLNKQSGERNTLRIETSKNNYTGKLETTASVCNTGDMFMEFQMFYDFLKTVIATEGRATKKRIAEQHRKALFELENIKKSAVDHYKQKGETLVIDDLMWLQAFNDKNFKGV